MYGLGSVEVVLLSDSVIQILKDLYDEYSRANLLRNKWRQRFNAIISVTRIMVSVSRAR